ncbi:MAG TPA: IS110 family transposase [Candidatus Acidoferrum sp.]|nr:IS110 family transposase [Candidatus Acidoferrum sp.]
MNTNSKSVSPEFAALIGLDWGDRQHAVALWDHASQRVETSILIHSPETLRAWLDELQARFKGRPLALALETSKGPLVHLLMEIPWLTLFPIHPATSARMRKAFTPSGAKDDLPDSRVLLDVLRHHRDRLRPLLSEDVATRRLAGLSEARRRAVDHRTQLGNSLRCLLKGFFPQALELVGEQLYSPLALDFFGRWPTLPELKASRPAAIKRFYHAHNVRRPEAVAKRLELIGNALALTTDEAIVFVSVRQLELLVAELRLVQKHIERYEQEIDRAFAEHPEAPLFRELPGAGKVLAPRLLAAFGTDRSRFANASQFQCYSGIAPVTEKSGSRVWIHWRWNAPWFVRQTLIEWAGQSTLYCAWAKAYYEQQKARGKGHWAIVRALAFKWIRILWKCWSTNTPYDDATYLKALAKRQSPLLTLCSTKKNQLFP